MEWVVGLVLKRAGILIDSQEWLSHQYPGLLEVSGKLDFVAGGTPDWVKAHSAVNELELPEFFSRATNAIILELQRKYPNWLDKIVLEIKSVSSFMMEKYLKTKKPDFKHGCQLFHYLKCKNMPEGHVVYISRDDLRMVELELVYPSPVEDNYKKDIETMTRYIQAKEMPPKEQEILFDEDLNKFSANFKVGYSNYLTFLYGYGSQKEYDEKYKPMVARFNRVMKRIVNGDKMTEKNNAAIEEMKVLFPNIDEIITKVKADPTAILEEPEEIAA